MPFRDVLITISNQTTGGKYWASSYPSRDLNGDTKEESYSVPVYKVFISGTDAKGNRIVKSWAALRFMPYWNDPKKPVKSYKTRGFVVSGLNHFPKQATRNYIRGYTIHNTYSEYNGAIQLKGNFLIHAGPKTLADMGWGGAGCVEIVGNFNEFKKDILRLADCNTSDLHAGMEQVAKAGKLFVELLQVATPVVKPDGHFY